MFFEIVMKMQISSNICLLVTNMMVFGFKIASINHTNKSSTDKVFGGCKLISFRNLFSSCFLCCALGICMLIDFPFLIYPPFYSILSLCQISDFLSCNTNQVIIDDLPVHNELMCSKSTQARVQLRARVTVRASPKVPDNALSR